MAFITKEELNTVGQIKLIDKIINETDTIAEVIIDESISIMKSYLSRFYDVEAIFSKTGEERNKTILKRLKDIVIYEIYNRNPTNLTESVDKKYNEAMDWLEKLNTGEHGDKTLPSIPKDEEIGRSGEIRFSSNQKYSSIY